MANLVGFRIIKESPNERHLQSQPVEVQELKLKPIRDNEKANNSKEIDEDQFSLPGIEWRQHFEIRWSNIQLNAPAPSSKRNWFWKKSKNTPTLNDKNEAENVTQPTTQPILSDLSGSVRSGELTAILGPSGVGKTSLLNALTGRNQLPGSGTVYVLGASARKRIAVCKVGQTDILPGELTVAEDLAFTSRLKCSDGNWTAAKHQENVSRVVRLLHLDKCLHTRCSKLSGGEQRRVSIARELLSSPDLMILDEPTSGLDSSTCYKIIKEMRNLVTTTDDEQSAPMSIIVTIHQPSIEVLELFHRTYVMAVGGQAIYEGPPDQLMPTLQVHGARLFAEGNVNDNPAIVAIEVASGEYGQEVIDELSALHSSRHVTRSMATTPAQFHRDSPSPGLPRQRASSSVTPLVARLTARHLRQQLTGSNLPSSAGSSPVVPPRMVYNSNGSPMASPMIFKRQHHAQKADTASIVTDYSAVDSYFGQRLPPPTSGVKVDKRLRRSLVHRRHFWSNTCTLIKRSALLTIRNKFLMAIRIIGFVMVGQGIVSIFGPSLDGSAHLCPLYVGSLETGGVSGDLNQLVSTTNSQIDKQLIESNTQMRTQHLFFFHLVLCMTMVTSAITGLVFPQQMRLFLREHSNGWYSLGSFITSNTLAELPIDLLGPLLSISITYPLCHQPGSDDPEQYLLLNWRFYGYIIICSLGCLVAKSQAQWVGALLMDSVENSVFGSCVMVTPPALLSGIAVRISEMPFAIVRWAASVSFLRYVFESLQLMRYGFGLCNSNCDPALLSLTGYPARPSEEAVPAHLRRLASVTLGDFGNDQKNSNSSLDIFDRLVTMMSQTNNLFIGPNQGLESCETTRSIYLIFYNLEDSSLIKWLLVLVLMFLGSRIITYFILRLVMYMRGKARSK